MNDAAECRALTIAELGDLRSGATPETNKPEYWDGDIAWVTPADLSKLASPTLSQTSRNITAKGLKHCSAELLPPYSLVLSSRAPIGYVAIPTVAFCTNQGCKSIELREGFDPFYTYYALLHQRSKIKQLGEGTTFQEISKTALGNVRVKVLADIKQQQTIGKVLATVDKAIAQTEALIAKQQRVKAGLMQDLLTRGIDEHGNLRSEATHTFMDSPLGRIPVEWEIVTLDRCVSSNAPICYGILMPGAFCEDGVPVIKVKDIYEGRVNTAELLLTSPQIDALYRRSRLAAGDLLITIRGTTGRVAIVPEELNGANITQDTARVRPRDGVSVQYLFHVLQSTVCQAQVELHTIGQAVKGINIRDIKKISFAFPAPREQEQIANMLDALDQTVVHTSRQLAKLWRKRDALMQDLLTGVVPVTPLLDAEEATA